ncbi:MerR family transcriptional regulator [Cohnella panacarvi]|uniref:MerR family transcriptional regulator n=1 Tax=Cohnella panacarvi TaxID=400776 RepID=UPI000478D11D|nr:MerR family transcriptional regulator [Cohnella panacarvi]
MKDKLTVSELAKLRRITPETLRHYDRIGLFKPKFVDPLTGYRYYSVLQYEEIGTIRELRQIGMTTDEIKQYFTDRNVEQSLALMKAKVETLSRNIQELQEIEYNVREKIRHIEEMQRLCDISSVVLKDLDKRWIITKRCQVNDWVELGYGFLELEDILEETAPILASNRLGSLISQASIEAGDYTSSSELFIFLRRFLPRNHAYVEVVEAGKYLCSYYHGDFWGRANTISRIMEYAKANGWRLAGDAVQIVQIDITVTDKVSEVLYEIQIPVRRVR